MKEEKAIKEMSKSAKNEKKKKKMEEEGEKKRLEKVAMEENIRKWKTQCSMFKVIQECL